MRRSSRAWTSCARSPSSATRRCRCAAEPADGPPRGAPATCDPWPARMQSAGLYGWRDGYRIRVGGCLGLHLADRILKIPVVALFLIVRWAVRQTPETAAGSDGGVGPRLGPRHPHRPHAPLPRSPRRGPHGVRGLSSPAARAHEGDRIARRALQAARRALSAPPLRPAASRVGPRWRSALGAELGHGEGFAGAARIGGQLTHNRVARKPRTRGQEPMMTDTDTAAPDTRTPDAASGHPVLRRARRGGRREHPHGHRQPHRRHLRAADLRRNRARDGPAPDQIRRAGLWVDGIRPRLHEHGLVSQRDHLHRRRGRRPAASRLSDRAAV